MSQAFKLQTKNENFEVNFNKLDDSQRAAVEASSNNTVIRAAAGSGKALRNGTNVLTIQGWKPIESLTTSDKVAAEDGKFYSVLGVYPQGLKQVYKITFSDKNIIECSGDHIWTWQSSSDRSRRKDHWQNSTTEELSKKSLQLSNGHWDVYLPQSEVVDFQKKDVPLNPYLLGALIGDGCMSDRGLVFTVVEEDLKEKIENILKNYDCLLNYVSQYDYVVQGPFGFGYNNIQNYVGATLRDLGLTHHNSHNKFIPDIYKYNTEEIRLGVLQGLIDTGGHCVGSSYDITLASKQLILDIQFICESLGFTTTYSEKTSYCNGKNCGVVYRLRIKTSKKHPKIHTTKNKDSRWTKGQSSARRTIRSIEKTDEFAEMTCIEVASPNHLYLTEHMIPTHNTSTLITAIAAYRYERLNDRICAITYTRAARAEMEERLHSMGIFDVEVTTIHVWARNLLNDLSVKYDFKVRVLEEMDIKTILDELVDEYRRRNSYKTKINIGILYSYITGNKNMDITDGYRRTLNALEAHYIQYKRDNNLYDFTDYPLYLYDVMTTYGEYIRNIDALFVDEFQDVDSTQFEIFEKVLSKKKFYIGDAWQCQPFGTQVMIRTKDGGKTKNIEDLKVGDPIVYYDQSQGYISGTKLPHNAKLKRVLNIEKYLYKNDYLITITSETGLESSYTSNHRTFVRFNRPQDKEAHAVYLMCNNRGRFRVGKIPLFYTGATNKSSNPWRDKMRAEGCTKIWLLKVFDNDHDARVEETKISYKYQIPQTCWQRSKVSWTKEDIDYIYEGLNTFYNAMQCLQDYGLNIAYPLLDENVEWQKRCHFTSNASSEIYAINLIPEFMSCLVFGSETSHKNLHVEKIIDVKKVFISEDEPICVCGLEVEGETYIADNIATHNSIFQFRGADGAVFTKLEDFDLYKLDYNYRSYQEIINYACTVYEKLKPRVEDDEECYITSIDFADESSIICNRGYGGTVSIIDPFGNGNHIKNKVNYYMDTKRQKEVFNEFIKTNPMILCRTNKQVKAIQEFGYSNVSTVHQAKGLEYDNVIVVDTTIKNMEDLNIAYVALTRARNNMLIINWSNLEQMWLQRKKPSGFSWSF